MCHNSIINKYINRIIFSLVKICYRFMKEIISLTVKAQQSKFFKIRPGHPILTKSFVSCCPYIFFSPNFKSYRSRRKNLQRDRYLHGQMAEAFIKF